VAGTVTLHRLRSTGFKVHLSARQAVSFRVIGILSSKSRKSRDLLDNTPINSLVSRNKSNDIRIRVHTRGIMIGWKLG